jgi:hypothetical protein
MDTFGDEEASRSFYARILQHHVGCNRHAKYLNYFWNVVNLDEDPVSR